MWDEPIAAAKASHFPRIRAHKECCPMQTARTWPWKLEPSKQCVTAGSPNGVASKMDDAERKAGAGRRRLDNKMSACVGSRGAYLFTRTSDEGRGQP
jgi:hypothetical protein